jgi:hypothetical protein
MHEYFYEIIIFRHVCYGFYIFYVFTFFITAFPENKRQIAPIDPKTTSIDRDGNIVL